MIIILLIRILHGTCQILEILGESFGRIYKYYIKQQKVGSGRTYKVAYFIDLSLQAFWINNCLALNWAENFKENLVE